MSPEHTEIIQVIRETAEMLLLELGGRIDRVEVRLDKVEGRLDGRDNQLREIINMMHTHHDVVLRRIERLEDEGVALNALLRRQGILTTAG